MSKTLPIPAALEHRYRGAGPALAAVLGGQLVALTYLDELLPDADLDLAGLPALLLERPEIAPAVRQLQALGAVTVGMCGGWTFTEL